MKIRITHGHVSSTGAVNVGIILEVEAELAAEYLNAKLAVPHKEDKLETATKTRTKETAKTR